jgi:hypothetical protein
MVHVPYANDEAVCAGNAWNQLSVPFATDIKQHFIGDFGLEGLKLSIFVRATLDTARPPQTLQGLPNQSVMRTIPMHLLISSRTNRLMNHPETIHDGRSSIAQKAFLQKYAATSMSGQTPELMFTLIPWMEILHTLCLWVASPHCSAAWCCLEFECNHGKHRSLGAAFLVACFLKMLGAKVTLFHHKHHRLCRCCTKAQFGWQWEELRPIAHWIEKQLGKMRKPHPAWHVILDTIDHW